MAARPAALMRRFFGAGLVPVAFAFAQRIFRALARALISLRRCAADRRRLARLTGAGASVGLASPASPFKASICPSKASICSLSAITRRRSVTESSESDFIGSKRYLQIHGSQTHFLCWVVMRANTTSAGWIEAEPLCAIRHGGLRSSDAKAPEFEHVRRC